MRGPADFGGEADAAANYERCLERLVGIELRRWAIAHELLVPGLLHLCSVDGPYLLTHDLQAFEDGQRLLGRPVQQHDRLPVSAKQPAFLPYPTAPCKSERRAYLRTAASTAWA